MSSELKDPAFHARLATLIGSEKPFVWADRIGISKGAFSRIWNEGTVPGPDHLRRIHEAEGVSLDWLLTGEGPMRRDDAPVAVKSVSVLDLELLTAIIEAIEQALDETDRAMPPAAKAAMVAAIYDLYADTGKTIDKERVLRLVKSAA